MAGDRARVSYDQTRKWRGSVAQQGRVTVEADINEAAAIADERDRLTTLDLVGPVGTPDNGYTVTAFGSDSKAGTPGDLQIGAGTLYLGGERLDLDQTVTYSTQPEWLDHPSGPPWVAPAIPSADPAYELVMLVASEVEVSAAEDPALADVALGGPDTMQRRRILQRFMRRPATTGDCIDAWGEYLDSLVGQGLAFDSTSMMLGSTTSLLVTFSPPVAAASLCEPVATGGYLGAENQLIRVMISGVDTNGNPILVWGFDNASFLYRVSTATFDVNADATTATLESSPVDSFHFPAAGQAVELLWDAMQLTPANYGGPQRPADYIATPAGFVSQLTVPYDPDQKQLIFQGQPPDDWLSNAPQLYLRVWQETVVAPFGSQVKLGDTGLAVTLSSTSDSFNIGDFWQFAVRPINPTIVYPARYTVTAQPAEGPRTWACPLAVLTWQGGNAAVSSCVPPFSDLVALTAATKCGCTVNVSPDDVNDGAGLPALISSFADRGPVSICLDPGTYTLSEPIVLGRGLDGITLRGCDGGVVLAAASPAGPDFSLGLIVVEGLQSVKIERLELSLPLVPFSPPSDAFVGLRQPSNQKLMTAFATGLQLAIGISTTDASGLSVGNCAFTIPDAGTANVFGAGIYSTGAVDGFELTGCTFETAAGAPDVLPFHDLTAGTTQTEPPYQVYFGFLHIPAALLTGGSGDAVPPLHDAAIERCVFEGVTVPALIMSQLGTIRIDQNTVRDCYGGFWLISPADQSTVVLLDSLAIGDPNVFSFYGALGLGPLLDRIYVLATATATVMPAPSSLLASAPGRISGKIVAPSPDLLEKTRNTARAMFASANSTSPATPAGTRQASAAAAAGGAGSAGKAGNDASGSASAGSDVKTGPAAVPPGFEFLFEPQTGSAGQAALIPTAETGTSVSRRLDICDCQVDAVIANSYSGAGLVVADLSQIPGMFVPPASGSALLHGSRIRTRSPFGDAVLIFWLTEASVTGNIVANEVPLDPNTAAFSITTFVNQPYGVPAIAVTGNVFIDPTSLPARPSTIPSDLVTWDVLNTVIDFVPPPVVMSIQPQSDVAGNSVTITGSWFTNATAVMFGSNPATGFGVTSDTQMSAVIPDGSGTVDVTVTTPAGVSATNPADLFTYSAGPSAVSAAAGGQSPPAGGAVGEAEPGAGSSASGSPAAATAPTAPKTPRSKSGTPSTAVTRPMQRPTPPGAEPGAD